MKRHGMALALVFGLVAAAIVASPATGTFAGHNGRIVFSHFTSSSPAQITTLTPSRLTSRPAAGGSRSR